MARYLLLVSVCLTIRSPWSYLTAERLLRHWFGTPGCFTETQPSEVNGNSTGAAPAFTGQISTKTSVWRDCCLAAPPAKAPSRSNAGLINANSTRPGSRICINFLAPYEDTKSCPYSPLQSPPPLLHLATCSYV